MQADQIHLIALKVQRKYWSEPRRDTQRWMSRHDELMQGSEGLPKQELPATMLSMDFKRVWITDRSAIMPCPDELPIAVCTDQIQIKTLVQRGGAVLV